jgi:hypothetical protein
MEKFYRTVGLFLVTVVVMLLVSVPATWFIMVAIGILHDRWEGIPAFGYWETYVVWVAFNFAIGAVKSGLEKAQASKQ